MLQDTYYTIVSRTDTAEESLFEIQMLGSHPVYQGHFPGNPVSPGVCNMQMIKELAEQLIGHEVMLDYVKQYRLMEVLSPQKTPQLSIHVSVEASEDAYTIRAAAYVADTQAIDFKGEAHDYPKKP